MPIANIQDWSECPECGQGLEFNKFRENALECSSVSCQWTERGSIRNFTDFMECPDCHSSNVQIKGGGYRENRVYCGRCGLEEGDIY